MADSWGVGSELWNDGCTAKQRDVVSFTAKEALSEEYKYDWRENAIAVKKRNGCECNDELIQCSTSLSKRVCKCSGMSSC